MRRSGSENLQERVFIRMWEVKASDIFFYDGYINAICPFSPPLGVCTCAGTRRRIARCVVSDCPCSDVGFQPATAAFLWPPCEGRGREGVHPAHPRRVSGEGGGGWGHCAGFPSPQVVGGAPGETVSGLGLPIPGEPPQLPACFPAGNGRSRARLRGLRARVCVRCWRPLVLRFPGGSLLSSIPLCRPAPGTSAAGISGAGGGSGSN